MNAHWLQHVPFEGLGSIEPWLLKSGYGVSVTRFFESDYLPDLQQVDLLIVMGGPMSVNDEDQFPWLVEEKAFIRKAIHAGKPVLGVCLGAQLIAEALGAAVYPNSVKEIGWFPITGIEPAENNTFCFPKALEVFHWHGETFELPPGAIRLASSKGCENQAFQFKSSVMGLQFHLETTPQSAVKIVSNCRAELKPSRYIQSEEKILSVSPEKYRKINRLMEDILDYLCRSGAAK